MLSLIEYLNLSLIDEGLYRLTYVYIEYYYINEEKYYLFYKLV